MIKKINHIAIVVPDIESALPFWRDILQLPVTKQQTIERQQAHVAFLEVGESQIEFVEPMEGDNGIGRYLAKRGVGMHHLCLEVDDIDAMLARLKSADIRLITPEPQTDDDGKKLAFIHPSSTGGVLVELYQLPPPTT